MLDECIHQHDHKNVSFDSRETAATVLKIFCLLGLQIHAQFKSDLWN